jgi:hypothetical protein
MSTQNNLIIVTGSVKHLRSPNKQSGYVQKSISLQHSNIQGNLIWISLFYLFLNVGDIIAFAVYSPMLCCYAVSLGLLFMLFGVACYNTFSSILSHSFSKGITTLFHDIFMLFFKRNESCE